MNALLLFGVIYCKELLFFSILRPVTCHHFLALLSYHFSGNLNFSMSHDYYSDIEPFCSLSFNDLCSTLSHLLPSGNLLYSPPIFHIFLPPSQLTLRILTSPLLYLIICSFLTCLPPPTSAHYFPNYLYYIPYLSFCHWFAVFPLLTSHFLLHFSHLQ